MADKARDLTLDDLDDPALARVLDALPEGSFTVDGSGHIRRWNRRMEELSGYSADEVLGRPCSVLEGDRCFPGADERPSCDLFEGCSIQGRHCRIRRKDGSWVEVVKSARLLYDAQGGVTGGIESVTGVEEASGLEEELARLEPAQAFHGMVGRHSSMQRLFDLLARAARSDSTVLILGETGTGKGIAAKALHDMSPRRDGPFVRVSCAALSDGVLESELFGHVRGAFTGAVADRRGRFEAADGGTLFLDEIGDVSPAMQMRLLRVIEEMEFERVGSNRSVQVDVRVVAATHRDLPSMSTAGTFRSDLYYRLAAVPLRVPPLRERPEDLPLLARHLLERIAARQAGEPRALTADALHALEAWHWPGNVRELWHALEYAVMASTGPALSRIDLPPTLAPARSLPRTGRVGGRPSRAVVLAALRRHRGRRVPTAADLGVSRMTLWKWMRDLDIDGNAFT